MSNRVTLKPSLLVGASITRSGGLSYSRTLTDESLDGQHEIKQWEVTRDVPNLAMLKAADAVASECRRMLMKVCYRTAFGLVCPKDAELALEAAIAAIRDKIEAANTGLVGCKLASAFVRGEILTNDQEAANAIAADLAGFFSTLQQAIERADTKTIRQTLMQMKGLDQLLPDVQSKALGKAIGAAKQAAKTLAREVEKKGRQIEEVRKELDLSEIEVARIAFVEVDGAGPAPAVPEVGPFADRAETVEV